MNRLRKLVLKPTVFCYHKCPYCDLRQDFYREMLENARQTGFQGKPGVMPLDQLIGYAKDAYELGMRECLLSGGDPLLYPHLIELIRKIKEISPEIFVFMNSVGTGLDYDKALGILDAGLGAWNLSVDTLDPDKYDEIRGVKGGLRQLTDALSVLRRVRHEHAEYEDFRINFMTVLTRHNYRDLPELFSYCVENDVASVFLMNVYGDDDENRYLLSVDQIEEFRKSIVPQILSVLETSKVEDVVRRNARKVLSEYFGPENTDENYANGVWWKDLASAHAGCQIPESYALIEADGNVLPCCLVEISHDGIVGNVKEKALGEIWDGETFNSFRKERIPFCQKCSAPLHRTIGLVPSMCQQFPG